MNLIGNMMDNMDNILPPLPEEIKKEEEPINSRTVRIPVMVKEKD